MGAGNASTGGGGGGVGPAGLVTKTGETGTAKDAKKTSNRNEFSSAVKKVGNYVKSGGAVGSVLRDLKKFTKPSAKQIEDRKLPFGDRNQYHKIGIINKNNKGQREFFTNRVLKGTEKVKFGSLNSTEQEKQYKSYMEKRLSGETDAIGRTRVQGSGGDPSNPINQATKNAPTVGEVDQATTDTTPTETAETTEKNRLLKVKKRGRSSSIMTGAKGVTKTSSDYSLGTSSLLGRV